ncbi:NACHT domain-containing protein [Pseudomonas syringae group sp. 243L2]|uniref:NACHT domain-containing protein n=1 Tax=Pseudomonas syringae group sp. 243L2 TaxID=3079593 RepID=UPI00290E28BA|nr:NACHT domain-containing protein [Pseudomonas syringae group sp. 243L2]MDU8632097.1 NACHT domain-containing protein [Pseudomonas syringae group sp. 243L2]
MTPTEANDVISVFSGYGFEYRADFSSNSSMVFTIKQGIFDNAAVLKIPGAVDDQQTHVKLEELGFQVKDYVHTTIVDLENKLFGGFFSIAKTKQNFIRDYEEHIEKIRVSFPETESVYRYISTPYTKNFSENTSEDNVLEDIKSELLVSGPRLVLIEAAAGFGKTCTAYEIAKMISGENEHHIVLFAELSRDRQAKIFSHVLHKELARSFPAVSIDLVLREIKNGRVIVVLDGFDELLKEREEEDLLFEKSQAMLETIAEILNGEAKVVLTTRKTAILQGDDFDEWIGTHTNDFDFVRYSLKEPSIRYWLPVERITQLQNSRINIKNIANPVLLTFLKFVNDEQFSEILDDPDSIVDKYFSSMFTREIKRQDLKLTTSEQSNFLMRLAQNMMEYDYTRDTKENIIGYFSHTEINLIEESRARYEVEGRPTYEEMVDRFSNHALLDRSKIDNKIGFINDFVLGHFVARDLIESKSKGWVAESIFVEAAINSFSSRSLSSREDIWSRLSETLEFIPVEDRIQLELRLLDRATGDVSQVQFNNIVFNTTEFFVNDSIKDCYFHECRFQNCTLNWDRISNCVFHSCTFYDCMSNGTNNSSEMVSCEQFGSHIWDAEAKSQILANPIAENHEIKSFILEKFWPIGKETIAFAHRPIFIFYRGNPHPSHLISEALEEMRKEGIITSAKKKNWIGLDLSAANFSIVKDILGR